MAEQKVDSLIDGIIKFVMIFLLGYLYSVVSLELVGLSFSFSPIAHWAFSYSNVFSPWAHYFILALNDLIIFAVMAGLVSLMIRFFERKEWVLAVWLAAIFPIFSLLIFLIQFKLAWQASVITKLMTSFAHPGMLILGLYLLIGRS